MPRNDSPKIEQTERDPEAPQPATNSEEIVTPVEADIQARVERDFNNPPLHKKAIVSVNGEDVDEVPASAHDRAA